MKAGYRVAIPVPTEANREYNRRSWPMYAAAVEQAGGSAVEVGPHLSEKELMQLARECQGVLLPGSPADVSPLLYGQEPTAACAPTDARRETTDRILLEECYRSGKPILGICYGVQSLNVWRGGTLVQDLMRSPVNHSAGGAVAIAHSTAITEGSFLEGLVDQSEAVPNQRDLRLPVNSSHHQSIDQVGAGLRVCAVSTQDGVIEAVEGSTGAGDPAFVLGVQWHPERSLDISGTSRAIFRAFLAEVERWAKLHT